MTAFVLLYINVFFFCYRSSDVLSFIHFADDTNIFVGPPSNPLTLAEIVNNELVNILQCIR